MTITAIISLVLTLLPTILSDAGVIPAPIAALIAQLSAAIPGLITNLTEGKGATSDIVAILSALQTELTTLQGSGTLSSEKLQLAQSLDADLTAALSAYQAAEVKDDPSTLTPLPTDL